MSFQASNALATAVEEPDDAMEVSVEMPADMLAALRVAGFQRQSLGYAEVTMSSLVCTAVAEWLEREIQETATFAIRL